MPKLHLNSTKLLNEKPNGCLVWKAAVRKAYNAAILALLSTSQPFSVEDLDDPEFNNALADCLEIGRTQNVMASLAKLEKSSRRFSGSFRAVLLYMKEYGCRKWLTASFVDSDNEADWHYNLPVNHMMKFLCYLRTLSKVDNIMGFLTQLSEHGYEEFVYSLCCVNDLTDKMVRRSNMPLIHLTTHKPTLVLDLDETLIHTETVKPYSYDFAKTVHFGPNERITFYVSKRPYVDYFLKECARHFELVCWTAGEQKYADAVLNEIDSQRKITHRLYRQHCTKVDNTTFVKNLSQVTQDLSRVAILDNSCVSFAFDLNNGIPIYPYRKGRSDVELLEIIPFLAKMRKTSNFQHFLSEYFHMEDMVQRMTLHVNMNS